MKDILKKIESLINSERFEEADNLLKNSRMTQSYKLTASGAIAFKKQELQKAEVEFLKAIELDKNNVLAAGNLATLYMTQKKPKKALPYAKIANNKLPNHENFARLYCACLSESDKNAEAVEVLRPFVEKEKPSLGVLLNYSAVLRGDLRAEESLAILERARELYPDSEEADRGIADAYAEIDPVVAQKAFLELEKKLPDNVQLKWNASFVELRLRNFPRGWELYEYGLLEKIGRIGRPLPPQIKSIKLVTNINELDKNKWTIFSAEQGLGDQVLFLSCLTEALELFPKSILVGEDRMVSILQRSFPNIGVYTYGFGAALSRQAHRCNGVFPIGSLMKQFRSTAEDFIKKRKVFITPDIALVQKYKSEILKKIGKKKIIGISWRGGFWDRQKRTKSFDFWLFSRLMTEAENHFVSLQYGDTKEERDFALQRGLPISFIDGFDFRKNIEKWLALTCACDEVVSVSTALVHFAGACGVPTKVLIGDYQAPFIWGLESGSSLPYESVTIQRKRENEPAEAFFDRLKEEIL